VVLIVSSLHPGRDADVTRSRSAARYQPIRDSLRRSCPRRRR
jgi:hypothetical protein